jgi:HEAT repeat protein
MEWLVLLPYGVGVLGAYFGFSVERRKRRAQMRIWQSVAERLGLREVTAEQPLLGEPRLRGRAERRRVRFDRLRVGKRSSFTRLTVEGSSGITLRPERPKDLLSQDLLSLGRREREIELGDEVFDAAVEVRGAPERVRALLDVETRAAVLGMLSGQIHRPGQRPLVVRGRVELVDGELTAVLDEQPAPPTHRELFDAVEALLALAARFAGPAGVAGRLAATVASEPMWRVRLQGLQVLATSFPDHPSTLPALRHALADERPEVALDAALLLGEEGVETLLEIARREAVDDATAARAVHALGDLLPVEIGVPLLRRALRQRRLAAAAACIQALAGDGGEEVGELLTRVLSLERGALAVEAAKALRRRPGAATEQALLAALERGDPELTLAAVEALGHTGTVRAVPAIQEAAAGDAGNAEIRRAARQAVAAIQSRLTGATPGQLSIAEGEAGQLSLADQDPRGRVSLAAGGAPGPAA